MSSLVNLLSVLKNDLTAECNAVKRVISQSCAINNSSPNPVLTSNYVAYNNGINISLDIIEFAIKWIEKNEDADAFPASFIRTMMEENSQYSTIDNAAPVEEPAQSVFTTDPV
jgi:hypothetical protein